MSSPESSPQPLKVSAVNRLFVGFIARRPWLAITLGLALVAGLAAGMKHLHADFTHKGFFWADDPKLLRLDAFERRFGNDDMVLIAVRSPSGIFDEDSASLIQEMTRKMWQVPEVIRVESITNFNWVHSQNDDIVIEPLLPETLTPQILAQRRQVALTHETLPGYLINRDGTVTVIMGRIKPGLDAPPDAPRITRAVRQIAREGQRGDHEIHVGGGPVMTNAFEEITQSDIQRLVPMALGIAALFLLLLLRSTAGVLLPFVAVFGAVLATFGFAGWLGLAQTAMSTAVPSILIAVGIADTVHILVTFLEELRRGTERRQAAHNALTRNLLATFLTCLTTAIGFFSFFTANLKPVGILGTMAGVGALVAWVVAQLVVGGLLFVLPIKAKPLPPERFAATDRRASTLVDFIARHRIGVIVTTLLLSGAALWVSLGIDVNSDPIKYFRHDLPVRVASDFMERTMGNARSFELVVSAGEDDGIKDPVFLSKVDAFQTWLEKQPRMTRAVSILDILKATHKSLHGDRPEAYRLGADKQTIAQELLLYTMGLPQGMDVNDRITVRNDALRITVLNTIVTSREAVAAIEGIVAQGKRMGLDVEATGKYYLYQQTNDYVVQSFLTSLWSATLLIGIIMMIFLRSVRLGLISMFPNIVPLFAGGALLRLLGQPLDMGTVLVASVCLGISIDDTSHVLATFAYHRRQGVPPNQAMRLVMAHTGPALLSTNGILIASFASFATATFVPNIYFGVLTAFILTMALVADMFFTPALLLQDPRREAAAPAQRAVA
jgi:predicted RND superfamily exporter protein